MAKPVALGVVLVLLLGALAYAEEPDERPALTYDAVNPPLAEVIETATRAKRPIFLEFYADG